MLNFPCLVLPEFKLCKKEFYHHKYTLSEKVFCNYSTFILESHQTMMSFEYFVLLLYHIIMKLMRLGRWVFTKFNICQHFMKEYCEHYLKFLLSLYCNN